jgi:hypothetical protein
LYAILHISHTYVPPLNPVGLLELVGGGMGSDMSYMYRKIIEDNFIV